LNILSLQAYTIQAAPNQQSILFEQFEVNANIYETLAVVNVSGTFSNPSDVLAIGEFTIKLPQGAYVDNISLVQNKTTYWGRVMRIQEAQEAFINATEANRSATILTQRSKYEFQVEYSIEAHGKIQISLVYFKRLIRFKGHYELFFDLDSIITQNPQSIETRITILSPIRIIQNINAPSGSIIVYQTDHNVSVIIPESSLITEDIELRYDLYGASVGNNILAFNNGSREFFVSTFSPSMQELGISGLAKDFVFLIDVSGSMGGEKIDQAKSSLLYIIDQLHEEDNFGIVSFSNQMSLPQETLVSKSNLDDVTRMKTWVSNLVAGGSTDINGALLSGLDLFGSSERPLLLVLLTDGRPTSGVTDPTRIEENFHAENTVNAALFTLGFGSGVNFELLGSLARQNSGEALKIEENIEAVEQITNFYDSVSTPIFKDVKLAIMSGVVDNEVFPYFIPNLFDGSEMFLVGEREAGEAIHFVISGDTSVGQLSYNFELDIQSSSDSIDSWIELTWAIAKIDDLLKNIEYGDSTTTIEEIVITMAFEYGLVTPYTAIFIDTQESLDTEYANEEYSGEYIAYTTYSPDSPPGAGMFPEALGLRHEGAEKTSLDIISILVSLSVLGYSARKIRRNL
jgi:uncharacterized protein YegL